MGQGDAAEANQPTTDAVTAEPAGSAQPSSDGRGNGAVVVDFGGLGPAAA